MDLRGKAKMTPVRLFLAKFVIIIVVLAMVNSVFSQGKKEEIISFPGFIKNISKDYKFIVVNTDKILISPNTRIINEKEQI